MNRLHRYIFSSLLTVVFSAVTVFVFILITGNILQSALGLYASGQLSGMLFCKLLVVLIPYVIAYALPLGVLSGILIVLGRLSSQQEITAMKSAGVGIKTFSAPILFISCVSVCILLFINNYYAPMAKQASRKMLASAVGQNPVEFIQPKEFIKNFPGYIIYIDERKGNDLRGFWIWELDDQKRVKNCLRAESGSFFYDDVKEEIVLTLSDGIGERRDKKNPEDFSSDIPMLVFKKWSLPLPMERLLGPENAPKLKISTMTIVQMLNHKRKQAQLLSETSNPEEIAEIRREIYQTNMRMHYNMSSAFSVFSLVLLGIPLGIQVGRKESYANAALALILALSYFVLQTSINAFFNKMPDSHGEYLLWIPNVLFQGIGICLFIRASKR